MIELFRKKKDPVQTAADNEAGLIEEAVALAERFNELSNALPKGYRFWFDFEENPVKLSLTRGGWKMREVVNRGSTK